MYVTVSTAVKNCVPCEIIGSVIDDAQPEELITEISIILDEMIKTVRDKEKSVPVGTHGVPQNPDAHSGIWIFYLHPMRVENFEN